MVWNIAIKPSSIPIRGIRTMHEAIQMLADRYGIKIKDRNANDSYIYDGKTLATHVTDPETNKVVYFSDHELLHDILHYVAASEYQRSWPEYGLYIGVVYSWVRGPKGVDIRNSVGGNHCIREGLVDLDEQLAQEVFIQLLTPHFGRKYNISPERTASLLTGRGSYNSWDEFKQERINRFESRSGKVGRAYIKGSKRSENFLEMGI